MVRFRSSSRYIPATILCRDFSLMPTTLALYQRSLRWFEASSCKPAPRGLPSSLAQLRAHYKTMRSWRTFLHISLNTTIFKITKGIIDSPDPSCSHNNLKSLIHRGLSCKNTPAIFCFHCFHKPLFYHLSKVNQYIHTRS